MTKDTQEIESKIADNADLTTTLVTTLAKIAAATIITTATLICSWLLTDNDNNIINEKEIKEIKNETNKNYK